MDHKDHRDHRATLFLFYGQVGEFAWRLKSNPNPCESLSFQKAHGKHIDVALEKIPGNFDGACVMEHWAIWCVV